MSLELERFQLARLQEKQANLERVAAGYFARVTEENEKALAKLREQEAASLAPYQAPAPPARSQDGRFEAAPGATGGRDQFAANKAALLAGLRAAG
jgi:hypothetical protein